MMYRTDDPVRDALDHQRRQDERLSRYPKCKVCGEHIQTEKCYRVDGYYFICLDCIEEVYTDDYIDEDY